MTKNTSFYFRLIHRYLGFYLVGIMAVYAISGTIMIFRRTDVFKRVTEIETQITPQLTEKNLGKVLEIKDFEITRNEGDFAFFKEGQYNIKTGEVAYLKKEYPFIIKKLEGLHKATTESPIYWLNIIFGASLLFFAVSSFWMFLPQTSVFKKGIYFSLAGIIMTLIILFL